MRWASCNIFSTQDHAAAAMAAKGTPVFAYKGETPRRLLGLHAPHLRVRPRARRRRPEHDPRRRRRRDAADPPGQRRREGRRRCSTKPDERGGNLLYAAIRAKLANERHLVQPQERADIVGVTEETTTGVHRLYEMSQPRARSCSAPSTSTTASRRASSTTSTAAARALIDGIKRATDVMIAGKKAVVCGYGDVGKGSAQALRALSAHGLRDRDRPHQRAAGRHGRLPGRDHGRRRRQVRRHLRHRHRQRATSSPAQHMEAMKDQRHRLQHRPLRQRDRRRRARQVRVGRDQAAGRPRDLGPSGKRIILLAKGRLVNLGCGTGHPSFVMSSSFANQTIAQIELFTHADSLRRGQGLRAAEAPRREGGAAAPEEGRRDALRTERRAGRLHRRAQAGAVQARQLPLLIDWAPSRGAIVEPRCPLWSSTCLSICRSRRFPTRFADRLRDRAARNHRSLQGELMAIIERAASEDQAAGAACGSAGIGTRGTQDDRADRCRSTARCIPNRSRRARSPSTSSVPDRDSAERWPADSSSPRSEPERAMPLYVAEPPPSFLVRPPMVVDCSVLCAVLFDESRARGRRAGARGRRLHRTLPCSTTRLPTWSSRSSVEVAGRRHVAERGACRLCRTGH